MRHNATVNIHHLFDVYPRLLFKTYLLFIYLLFDSIIYCPGIYTLFCIINTLTFIGYSLHAFSSYIYLFQTNLTWHRLDKFLLRAVSYFCMFSKYVQLYSLCL